MIRVLLADDSLLIRELVQEVLGMDDELDIVGVAVDGVEAVELAESLKPDVVLMDVRMPRLDGLGAARQIRAMQSVPIVMMSAGFGAKGEADLDGIDAIEGLTTVAKPGSGGGFLAACQEFIAVVKSAATGAGTPTA